MNPWKMMSEVNYRKLNAWAWIIFLCLIIVMSFSLITLHRWIGESSAALQVVLLIFTFCLLITVLMAVCMYLILKSHEKSKSLFDNEQRYKIILDSIKDNAIFTLTPLGHIKSWNIGAQRVYGYSDKEIIGKHFSLFYSREDAVRGVPLNVITTAQKQGKFEGEGIRIRRDGSPFWAHVLIEPIYNDKKRLAGFVNITRDVTENRKMEEEHSRLIALIEESSDFVGIADLQGNLLYHNRSAKRMVGLPDDYDMSPLKISDMHPQWAIQKVINEVIPSAFEKGFWTGELALLHRSGREIPVLQSVSLHRNAMGEPVCLTTIARDITERKAEEDATKASEEIFRSAMQHASTGMALISPTGKWLKVNQSICSMLGYTEEELLQSDFQTLTHPDDLETDLENVLLMLNKQIDSYQMEKRYIHKDGHIVWGLLSVSLVWDNEGAPKYFVSLVQNISYRKKAEAANKKLLQALESSNAELERFAYVASHDLQEPIRVINNFGDLLLTEKQDKLDDEGKEYLKIMTNAGLRMREVINDLLTYSRVHEDAKSILFDGENILNNALENIKALIEEQKAQITHDPMPMLYGNPMQIMRVLQNLITNAIKYQPAGNVPIIHIGVEDADPNWKINIQDNGLGIDEQFIKEIFEPFRRLHAWESIKGSGLGLSICKKIAEYHHGSLSVSSRLGIGSNFTLTLPKHNNGLHA
ncbi:PAS domain-containing sensor histidine kinase [Legionella saoudiensis]|uniref:PAS domain-containing sensor histidine kinase n=1 Tax=Legionella saoudiensis TaxID=1750561 RepID=UPI0018C2E321|nr:PAS domain-containing sensor histidine kinase [Legionella saoudiensis]